MARRHSEDLLLSMGALCRPTIMGGSRIFIGEGLQDPGAPFWLLKGRLCNERCQCTTTKIMHVGILIATPLAPGPYSAYLDCALRLMPLPGGHLTLSGRHGQLSGQYFRVN